MGGVSPVASKKLDLTTSLTTTKSTRGAEFAYNSALEVAYTDAVEVVSNAVVEVLYICCD